MPDPRPAARPARRPLPFVLAALALLAGCGGGQDDAEQAAPQDAPLWDVIDWDQDAWA